MSEYLLLSARRYDFKDEAGKTVEGVTVSYCDPEEEPEADRLGLTQLQISGPREIWGQLAMVPGYYGMDFRQRPGRGGKPTLQLVRCEYRRDCAVLVASNAVK